MPVSATRLGGGGGGGGVQHLHYTELVCLTFVDKITVVIIVDDVFMFILGKFAFYSAVGID